MEPSIYLGNDVLTTCSCTSWLPPLYSVPLPENRFTSQEMHHFLETEPVVHVPMQWGTNWTTSCLGMISYTLSTCTKCKQPPSHATRSPGRAAVSKTHEQCSNTKATFVQHCMSYFMSPPGTATYTRYINIEMSKVKPLNQDSLK